MPSSYKQGDLSFHEVRSVNLDEYYGLAPDHVLFYGGTLLSLNYYYILRDLR